MAPCLVLQVFMRHQQAALVTRACAVWCAGMNKMVVNHLDKLFVTSDASTIINEMEVQHPAAKLVVFASQAQEQEIGDGSNFVSAGRRAQPRMACLRGWPCL
jgi:TCP-1/cpn60 chaperonin family